MSLVLDLPPELETKLTSEAARLGISVTEYAVRLIAAGRVETRVTFQFQDGSITYLLETGTPIDLNDNDALASAHIKAIIQEVKSPFVTKSQEFTNLSQSGAKAGFIELLEQVRGRPTLRTGAELVGYWRDAGLVGTRRDIVDSQAHARALRQ